LAGEAVEVSVDHRGSAVGGAGPDMTRQQGHGYGPEELASSHGGVPSFRGDRQETTPGRPAQNLTREPRYAYTGFSKKRLVLANPGPAITGLPLMVASLLARRFVRSWGRLAAAGRRCISTGSLGWCEIGSPAVQGQRPDQFVDPARFGDVDHPNGPVRYPPFAGVHRLLRDQ